MQTALDGENTCIFAYGQTSSGKTYTMEGPSHDQFFDFKTNKLTECSGILPRAAHYIWKEMSRLRKVYSNTINFAIQVSALEIYCENIRDLLWEAPPENQGQSKYLDLKAINNNKVKCIG